MISKKGAALEGSGYLYQIYAVLCDRNNLQRYKIFNDQATITMNLPGKGRLLRQKPPRNDNLSNLVSNYVYIIAQLFWYARELVQRRNILRFLINPKGMKKSILCDN